MTKIQNLKNKIKKIHFVGIKGVGMTPLAIIAKEAGMAVSGCDIDETFITDEALAKARIAPLVGFSKKHVAGVDLVITTGAHAGFDNDEVKAARAQGIPVLTQGEAVGAFMQGEMLGRKSFEGISIAGSHGKTTTTALVATVLKHARLDPSFVVGTGTVASLGAPGHLGKGKYFVAEADEYATEPVHDRTVKFLWQHPKIAVITNVEFDHPDLFETLDDLKNAFAQFTNNVASDGTLIVCGDDETLQEIRKQYKGRVVTYGFSQSNNYWLRHVSVTKEETFFAVEGYGTDLGEFAIKVPGEHNAVNALAAIVCGLEVGITAPEIKKGLLAFTGSKRRFEFVGRLASGALLFDDYAHHPTEIRKTLRAFRQSFPKGKIVCIFQPHTYSRTKKLFEDFMRSFSDANTVILTNIYPSLREKPDPSISSQKLALAMQRFQSKVVFLPNLQNVVEYIAQKQFGDNTVVITMGAGDVYRISEKLKVKS